MEWKERKTSAIHYFGRFMCRDAKGEDLADIGEAAWRRNSTAQEEKKRR